MGKPVCEQHIYGVREERVNSNKLSHLCDEEIVSFSVHLCEKCPSLVCQQALTNIIANISSTDKFFIIILDLKTGLCCHTTNSLCILIIITLSFVSLPLFLSVTYTPTSLIHCMHCYAAPCGYDTFEPLNTQYTSRNDDCRTGSYAYDKDGGMNETLLTSCAM